MLYRSLIGTVALGLVAVVVDAEAFDQAKYPDWTGAWRRIPVTGVTGQPGYDQTKRLGPAQQAPLTRPSIRTGLAHGAAYQSPASPASPATIRPSGLVRRSKRH